MSVKHTLDQSDPGLKDKIQAIRHLGLVERVPKQSKSFSTAMKNSLTYHQLKMWFYFFRNNMVVYNILLCIVHD